MQPVSVVLVTPVAKPRRPNERGQITFRAPDLYARLEQAASGLGLDLSGLLRMMIKKHLPEYERQAAEIRQREAGEKE